MVVQSERFAALGVFAICKITSDPGSAPLLRVPVAPSPLNGLRKPSCIAVEKLMSVRGPRVSAPIGRLSADEQLRLDRALALFLGFA